MTHWIHGTLGRAEAVARLGGEPIAMDAGIFWVPWDGPELRTLDEESIPEHEYLSAEMAAAHAAASGAEGLTFFETRYFGGAGGEVASAWVGGVLVVDRGTINEALAALGVTSDAGRDAFDTIGLGRHRSNPGER